MTAKPVLAQAGFAGEALDTALGVGYAESAGYVDAIGDWWQLSDPAVAAKWEVSVGWFQIRALDDPAGWGPLDVWRDKHQLLDPLFNARAAYAISLGGTDWHLWSAFRSGRYLEHKGVDYELRTGHTHTCDQYEGVHLSMLHFND